MAPYYYCYYFLSFCFVYLYVYDCACVFLAAFFAFFHCNTNRVSFSYCDFSCVSLTFARQTEKERNKNYSIFLHPHYFDIYFELNFFFFIFFSHSRSLGVCFVGDDFSGGFQLYFNIYSIVGIIFFSLVNSNLTRRLTFALLFDFFDFYFLIGSFASVWMYFNLCACKMCCVFSSLFAHASSTTLEIMIIIECLHLQIHSIFIENRFTKKKNSIENWLLWCDQYICMQQQKAKNKHISQPRNLLCYIFPFRFLAMQTKRKKKGRRRQ